jgi:hypothetical protein
VLAPGVAGQHRDQLAAVGLDIAEEFVGIGMPRRQLQFAGAETAVDRLDRGAVPVEVIALGDLPGELDAVGRGRPGAEREGLVDRQQVGLVDGGGGRCQPGQRGQQQGGSECAHGFGRVSACSQSR